MQSIYEYLTFTTKIEHDLEHDLTPKKLYSLPKINNANGDLSKRWYVYFSFRNPETDKMKRLSNIYGEANKYKTKEDRLSALTIYRKRLLNLLKQGYNPFVDNTELYQSLQQKAASKPDSIIPSLKNKNEAIVKEKGKEEIQVNTIATNQQQKLQQLINDLKSVVETVKDKSELLNSVAKMSSLVGEKEKVTENKANTESEDVVKMVFSDAFDFAFKLKEKEVSKATINDYKGKINKLLTWLSENCSDKKYIDELKRKDILDFLNAILLKTSARTRNNYRSDLSSLFQILKNNELIAENHLKTIKVLSSKPEKHKRYTIEQQQDIFNYLEKEDEMLSLYIKFIYYGFMRPIEVSRLRIKDIDIKNKTLQFQSKTKKLKTKIIPDILLEDMPDISKLNKDGFLFTPDKIGGDWNANEINRRDHFTKRFSKIVKNKFDLKEDYGLYSFRHTAITRLYNKLKNDVSEFEAKSKLMPITGHTTMIALEKYLRDIDADLPEDYSDLFKIDTV
jgi:integrase